MTIHFTVPGVPVPKGRPRVTRYGTYTPKSTVEYEERVRKAFFEQCGHSLPTGKPIFCYVKAGFPIPQSLSKKKKQELAGTHHLKRGDLDNVVKAVLDALNGVAFEDDSLVCHIVASKRYSTEPHTFVELVSWEAEE